VFTLLGFDEVDLPTTRRESACILSPDAEKYQLGCVSKIKADAAAIWAAILHERSL
jgi:hypothetical protein